MVVRRSSLWRVLIALLVGMFVVVAMLNATLRPFAPQVDPDASDDPYATSASPSPPESSASESPISASPSPEPSTSLTPTNPPTSATPSRPTTPPAPSTKAVKACAQDIGNFVPARVVVKRLGVDAPVLAQPLGDGGTLPSVPNFGADAFAWWKDGAKPGDNQGVVYTSVHTYTDGEALGNLFGRKIKQGDVIMVFDQKGRIGACYEVTSVVTKPAGDVKGEFLDSISRTDGKPFFVIGFCWDVEEDWGKHLWKLRRYVIATQLP